MGTGAAIELVASGGMGGIIVRHSKAPEEEKIDNIIRTEQATAIAIHRLSRSYML